MSFIDGLKSVFGINTKPVTSTPVEQTPVVQDNQTVLEETNDNISKRPERHHATKTAGLRTNPNDNPLLNKSSYAYDPINTRDAYGGTYRDMLQDGYSMPAFASGAYGSELEPGEVYAAEKEIVDANREQLIPAINEYYLSYQVYDDMISFKNSYDIPEQLFDDLMKAESFQGIVADILDGKQVDLDNLDPTHPAKTAITRIPGLKDVLKNIQTKFNSGQYEQYDINGVNVDDIPQEFIEGADYSSVEGELFCPTINTLNMGKKGTGKITTDVEFKTAVGDDVAISLSDIDFSDKKAAFAEIENRIAQAYGLEDTNGDGRVSLDSVAGSAIIDAIARAEGNNEMFKGYDVGKPSVKDFLACVAKYVAEGGQIPMMLPDVDISITGRELEQDAARAELMKEGKEVKFGQLHVTQPSLEIGKDIKTGVDVLEYIEYGDTNLKAALQDSVIAQGLDVLEGDEFKDKSFNEVVSILQNGSKEGYQEAYNNLMLVKDKFENATNLADAIKDAKAELKGKKVTSLPRMIEIASTAIRQELGNNPELYKAFNDGKNDNPYELLNADLVTLANGNNTFKLEDVNYNYKNKEVYYNQTTPEPEPEPEPEPCEDPDDPERDPIEENPDKPIDSDPDCDPAEDPEGGSEENPDKPIDPDPNCDPVEDPEGGSEENPDKPIDSDPAQETHSQGGSGTDIPGGVDIGGGFGSTPSNEPVVGIDSNDTTTVVVEEQETSGDTDSNDSSNGNNQENNNSENNSSQQQDSSCNEMDATDRESVVEQYTTEPTVVTTESVVEQYTTEPTVVTTESVVEQYTTEPTVVTTESVVEQTVVVSEPVSTTPQVETVTVEMPIYIEEPKKDE